MWEGLCGQARCIRTIHNMLRMYGMNGIYSASALIQLMTK